MERGTIVQTVKGDAFYIYLKDLDDENCKCAVVEDVFDEFEQYFSAKVTTLITVPKDTIIIATAYPNYFNQISIT